MARQAKSLIFEIAGKIDQFEAATAAARATLKDTALSFTNFEATVDANMQKFGGDVAGAAMTVDQQLGKMMGAIKRNMQAMAAEGNNAGALKLFDLGLAEEKIRQLELAATEMRALGLAAKATAEAEGKLHGVNAATSASMLTAAGAAEQEAASLRTITDALRPTAARYEAARAAAAGHAETIRTGTAATRQSRAGMQQLSYQLNDVAVQFQMGTPIATIFGQQIGQVTQAMSMMTTKTTGLLGFIGGPWCIALASALVVLTPFVSKLFESGDAADDAGGAMGKLRDRLDLSKNSYESLIAVVEEYNQAQGKSNALTYDAIVAAEKLAKTNLDLAKAKLLALQADDPTRTAGSSTEAATMQAANDQLVAYFRKEIAQLEAELASAGVAAGTERVKRAIDERYNLEVGFDEKIARLEEQRTKRLITQNAYESQRLSLIKQQTAALKAFDDAHKKAGGGAAGSQAAVGDMTALIKQLFAGAQITATTGGGHKKGSDHYAGRAIDFVVPGMMTPEGTKQVDAALQAAGVDIRRNARGTEQFFGPGRSADKPGDHNDHFHLAWEGQVDPEKAAAAQAKEAETLAREANARQRRQQDALSQADNSILGALLTRADTEDARLSIQLEMLKGDQASRERAIDRETADKIAQGMDEKQAQADAAELKAKWRTVDMLDEEALRGEARQKKFDEQLDIERGERDGKISLLRLQSQFAETLAERKRIALQILAYELQERRIAAERLMKSSNADDRAQGVRQLGQLNREAPLLRQGVESDNADPVERYLEHLRPAAGDTEEAMQRVRANGLQSLEDGLVGVISGTESVASAFKKMANQIIADLVRVAVQKLILNVISPGAGSIFGAIFGHAEGGIIEKKAGGGLILGPGTGTSDSIPALLSNGEFVMTAAATARYRPLLEAINDGRTPGFAGGGLVRMPRLPSGASMRGGGGGMPMQLHQHFHVDARGAVLAEQLVSEMQRIGATAAIGGSQIAQQELAEARASELY